MSNHYHLVLSVDPEYVVNSDDFDVAQRGVVHKRVNETDDHRLARALVWRDSPEQIAKLRTAATTGLVE